MLRLILIKQEMVNLDNTLIEIIKNSTPIVQSSISTLVGAVIGTLFLRKNTNTTEFEKIKTGHFKEVIDTLLDKGKMTYYEYYKCNNFLKIAELADEMRNESTLGDDHKSNDYDFDWFMRFFDTAGNVSNADMQKLWAKILFDEVENTGAFSLRAIETLKNMNQYEAALLQTMAHFVLTAPDGSKFILSTSDDLGEDVNEKYGLKKSDLITLEECGILNPLRSGNRISLDSIPCGFWNEKILLSLKLKNSDGGLFSYKYSGYHLTKSACQLLSVVDADSNDEYLLDVGREFAKKYNGNFIVEAYQVIDGSIDSFKYDSSQKLLLGII